MAGKVEPGSLTILVVEDEQGIRELVREVLTNAGFQVLTAANGEEALRTVEAHGGPVELVLTDLIMPGVDGLQLARRLRTLQPGLKVVLMSGYGEDRIDEAGGLEGEASVLEKPFTGPKLLAKIRELLDE